MKQGRGKEKRSKRGGGTTTIPWACLMKSLLVLANATIEVGASATKRLNEHFTT
jgi:hypothetical protein